MNELIGIDYERGHMDIEVSIESLPDGLDGVAFPYRKPPLAIVDEDPLYPIVSDLIHEIIHCLYPEKGEKEVRKIIDIGYNMLEDNEYELDTFGDFVKMEKQAVREFLGENYSELPEDETDGLSNFVYDVIFEPENRRLEKMDEKEVYNTYGNTFEQILEQTPSYII
jgi:hypothetical protein